MERWSLATSVPEDATLANGFGYTLALGIAGASPAMILLGGGG